MHHQSKIIVPQASLKIDKWGDGTVSVHYEGCPQCLVGIVGAFAQGVAMGEAYMDNLARANAEGGDGEGDGERELAHGAETEG